MTINTENLTKLIRHLKKAKPSTFNMSQWIRFNFDKSWYRAKASELVERIQEVGDCGTVACLAGHAGLLRAAEEGARANSYTGQHAKSAAAQWLGLNEEQAYLLFEPRCVDGLVYRASLKEALDTLVHLRNTAEEDEPEIHWESEEVIPGKIEHW